MITLELIIKIVAVFVILGSFNVWFFLLGIRSGERVIRKHGLELLRCADDCTRRSRSQGLNCDAEDSGEAARALRKQLSLPERDL